MFAMRINLSSNRLTSYPNNSNEEDHFIGLLHGVLDWNQAAFAFVQH